MFKAPKPISIGKYFATGALLLAALISTFLVPDPASSIGPNTSSTVDRPSTVKNSRANSAGVVTAEPLLLVGTHGISDEARRSRQALRNLQSAAAVANREEIATQTVDSKKVRVSSEILGNLLQFRNVRVDGNYRLNSKQVIRQAGLDVSPWLWQTSLKEVRTRLREHPWVEEVNFAIGLYPLELTLKLHEAEPWLIVEYEKHSWLVSRSGNLIQPLDALHSADVILETTELPRLDGLDPQPDMASYLSSANARFLYAVKLMKFVEGAGGLPFSVERFTLLPAGGMQLSPEPGSLYPTVLIAAESFAEAERALVRLGSILSDLNRRGERVRRIDLRFHNQAVVE